MGLLPPARPCSAWAASALLVTLAQLPTTAWAQTLVPDMGTPQRASGNTEIPVEIPGSTEVLEGQRRTGPFRREPPPLEEPVDAETYVCGPGDVLELHFWGKQNLQFQVVVDVEGRAFIPKVGYVVVKNQSLAKARSLIKKRIRRYYPGPKFDLTLAAPRHFLVHVAENVSHPGAYESDPLERVADVIRRADGPTAGQGSRRRIIIKRRDGSELAADLVMYSLTGDTHYNPRLLDGDVVQVPSKATEVSIDGPVFRPGKYELTGSCDLTELLALAGGFTSAVARALPIQVVRHNEKQLKEFHRVRFPKGDAAPNTPLKDGDRVIVPSAEELQRTVLLVGAVKGAGAADQVTTLKRMTFIEGDTVRSIIERAGGIRVSGNLREAYISRQLSNGEQSLVPVDLEALLVRRDFSEDKDIRIGDSIVIPLKRRSILIEGAVSRPGAYPFNPRFRIPEYIANAGGRTRHARGIGSTKLIRSSGETLRFSRNEPVKPGDTIVVPERNFSRSEIAQLVMAGAGLLLSAVAVGIAATR